MPSPDSTPPILALSEKFYSGYYASASRDVGGFRTLLILRPSWLSTRFPFNPSDSPSLSPRRGGRFSSPLPTSYSLRLSWVHRGSFSPGEKRRKHNIITISKSRFLMSSRGHNVPSPRSFVCRSRCFSRRVVDFPLPLPILYAQTRERKTSNRKTFRCPFSHPPLAETRMCSRSPALLANS